MDCRFVGASASQSRSVIGLVIASDSASAKPAPKPDSPLAINTATSTLMDAAPAGANRLMSVDDQPFDASLRALRWSITFSI